MLQNSSKKSSSKTSEKQDKSISLKGKLVLISLGLIAGFFISLGVYETYRYFSRSSRPIGQHDVEQIRRLMDEDSLSAFQYDPDLSFMLKANFDGYRLKKEYPLHTNSRHLLGKEEVATDPAVKKVLLLGDSVPFGEGVGYEYSFVTLLDRLMGDGIQISNGTCPGWSTHQEILFYEKYQSDIDWDKLIIVFCLNDLVRFEWVYESDRGYTLSPEMLEMTGLFGVPQVKKYTQLRQVRNNFLNHPATRPLADQNITIMHAWLEEAWTEYLECILQPFVDRVGAGKVIIVAAPTRAQMDALKNGAGRERTTYPQSRLEQFCRSADVHYIDLMEPLLHAEESLFKDETHLDKQGHSAVAEYLLPRLRKII